jgi:hypothetical protein
MSAGCGLSNSFDFLASAYCSATEDTEPMYKLFKILKTVLRVSSYVESHESYNERVLLAVIGKNRGRKLATKSGEHVFVRTNFNDFII